MKLSNEPGGVHRLKSFLLTLFRVRLLHKSDMSRFFMTQAIRSCPVNTDGTLERKLFTVLIGTPFSESSIWCTKASIFWYTMKFGCTRRSSELAFTLKYQNIKSLTDPFNPSFAISFPIISQQIISCSSLLIPKCSF